MHATDLIEEILKSRPDAQAIVLAHDLWCQFITDRIGHEVPEDGDIYEEAKRSEFYAPREPCGVRILEGEDLEYGRAEVIAWPEGM